MAILFPHLFSPTKLGSLPLKNRLVRSATYDAKADEKGRPTKNYIDFYRRLAQGGVGLIITGLAYPDKDGKLPRGISVEDDKCLKYLPEVTAAVHELNCGCKIALQIGHTGRQLPHELPQEPVAPSPILEPYTGRIPRELTIKEIETFIDKTAAAIGRAQKSGFDAVQLHAAHGWLLSSFLSPHTNQRKDMYGGNIINRARIMTEIIRRARSLAGEAFPVFAKMNACDFVDGGVELPEALTLGKILEDAGYAGLEISSGMWETCTRDPKIIGWKAELIPEARKGIRTVKDEAYHREFTKIFKKKLKKTKIILIGGLKTPSLMEEIISGKDADLVSLSRPFIREFDLPNLWLAGYTKKASCLSCNKCMETVGEENGLRCPLM